MAKGDIPDSKLRAGQVTVSVWKNQKGNNEWESFQLQRTYVDDSGSYHNTNSFHLKDIPDVIAVLRETYRKYRVVEVNG